MAEPLVIEELAHSYGATPTFADVSLALGAGQLLAVLGASGAGKSTLLRAVAGFVRPRAGSIAIAGETVFAGGRERVPAERRRVGMVFQDYALFPTMSVRANVAFGIHRAPDRHARVDALLAAVGIPELAERAPAELSGGQRQRVALARALAPRPRLLLLDEPFANVDGALRWELGEAILELMRTEGVSALLVTHDRGEALGLADKVAVLGRRPGADAASLLQLATPEEVYRRPRTRQVAALTGRATFLAAEGRGTRATTALGEVTLHAPVEGACTVLVRPEQLRFVPGEGACTVRSRRFHGASYHVELHSPVGAIGLECSATAAPAPDTRGSLRIEGECAVVE